MKESKMKYRCYQDGVRCSEYKVKTWDIDTFDTKREAEVFCYYWAFPISSDEALRNAPRMELCVPMDMSMDEIPVMMEIREVEQ